MFLGMMDLPPPVSTPAYSECNRRLLENSNATVLTQELSVAAKLHAMSVAGTLFVPIQLVEVESVPKVVVEGDKEGQSQSNDNDADNNQNPGDGNDADRILGIMMQLIRILGVMMQMLGAIPLILIVAVMMRGLVMVIVMTTYLVVQF